MATSPGWSHQPQTLPHSFLWRLRNIACIRAAISTAVAQTDRRTSALLCAKLGRGFSVVKSKEGNLMLCVIFCENDGCPHMRRMPKDATARNQSVTRNYPRTSNTSGSRSVWKSPAYIICCSFDSAYHNSISAV